MLAEYREFTLPGEKALHANITINPIGELEVLIKEDNHALHAEFDEVFFLKEGQLAELVCRNGAEHQIRWHLDLSNTDAQELAQLIQNAEEELELLMRDL